VRQLLPLGLLLATVQCAHEETRPFVAPTPGLETETRPAGDYDFATATPGAPSHSAPDEVGLATWYGQAFAGRKTSNGERFDPRAMTAAHRKLPFGTWVEVRRVDTGSSVRVRITDRGPWGDARRIIDVSKAAADLIGLTRDGVTKVELRVVRGPE
jgi:rare lipoprotein A